MSRCPPRVSRKAWLCHRKPFPTAAVLLARRCNSKARLARSGTQLRCTNEISADLGFHYLWYTCRFARCTKHFCLLISVFITVGTPGTPFQRQSSHTRARARRKRCTNSEAKLFSGTDVREASEAGPIPGMRAQSRLRDAPNQSVILNQLRVRNRACQPERSQDVVHTALAPSGRFDIRRPTTRSSNASLRSLGSPSAAGLRWLSHSRPGLRSRTTSRTSWKRRRASALRARQNRSSTCSTCQSPRRKTQPPLVCQPSGVLSAFGSQPPARG